MTVDEQIHEMEKAAMAGDGTAMVALVSLERRCRQGLKRASAAGPLEGHAVASEAYDEAMADVERWTEWSK